MTRIPVALALVLGLGSSLRAANADLAARATNELAVALHRQMAARGGNLCLSPYSIQTALAMAFAGAAGSTRAEMSRALHFVGEGDAIHRSFAALQTALEQMAAGTKAIAERSKTGGGPSEPMTLTVASRLYPQSGYELRPSFRTTLLTQHVSALEPLDFRRDASGARQRINAWIAERTKGRIRDLIPEGGVAATTRLILANAVYLKAAWAEAFRSESTQPQPFHTSGRSIVQVPMLRKTRSFGFAKRSGFTAVAVPYIGDDLQFLVLLPDQVDGLPALESRLTADLLAQNARLDEHDLDLSLPKFRLESETMSLSGSLQALGVKSAFDQPVGSADFDRMAPRSPIDYLYLSDVFHKTFIAVDEQGTEAAAATAAALTVGSAARRKQPPIVVRVDRPFLFAVQHIPSGTCLFLGRITDPR